MAKPRIQHDDIPEEMRPLIARVASAQMCQIAGIALSRIKSVRTYDPGLEGRSAIEVIFEPDLTPAEAERFKEACREVSAWFGGRPPIFPGAA